MGKKKDHQHNKSTPDSKNAATPNERPDDAFRLAKRLLRESLLALALLFWRGEFWRYTARKWERVGDNEMRSWTARHVKSLLDENNRAAIRLWKADGSRGKPPTVHQVTRSLVADVLQAIQAQVVLDGKYDQPLWLEVGQLPRTRRLLSFENGLADVDRLLVGEVDVLMSHTPAWFSPVVLPYRYDPGATCPKFLAFLHHVLEGDQERIKLVQEIFAYLLLVPDPSRQKFFILKYTGRLIWGQKSFHRRPGTREKVARAQPREVWRIHDSPKLRIVSVELWERVQARRATIRALLPGRRTLMRGKNAALYSPHLFSGFMRCATCGGAITVVCGGHGSSRYGCPQSWRNGISACTNRLTIRAKLADAYLLSRLKDELTDPATFQYIRDALATALNQQIADHPRLFAETQAARAQAHERLQRLFTALENGVPAASLVERITARQAELQQLDATLAELAEPRPKERLAVMPSWVRQQLEDLVGLLSDTPERTKQEFQRLGLKVTMTPTTADTAKSFYRATLVNALPCLAGMRDLREISPSTVDRLDLRSAR